MSQSRPLEGLRVIELGQLLAGPFAGTILGYFGAEVIKVEPPTGDPIRQWREVRNGMSLWYHSLARNKKSVTLDLKSDRGRELAFELLTKADVVIENFRPGAMESWGLGPEQVKAKNPGIIYARISGYGQSGPFSEKPGYASVTEGYGGSGTSMVSREKRRYDPTFRWAILSLRFTQRWVLLSPLSSATRAAAVRWLMWRCTNPSLTCWRVSFPNSTAQASSASPQGPRSPASCRPIPTCAQTVNTWLLVAMVTRSSSD